MARMSEVPTTDKDRQAKSRRQVSAKKECMKMRVNRQKAFIISKGHGPHIQTIV